MALTGQRAIRKTTAVQAELHRSRGIPHPDELVPWVAIENDPARGLTTVLATQLNVSEPLAVRAEHGGVGGERPGTHGYAIENQPKIAPREVRPICKVTTPSAEGRCDGS